MVHCWWDFSLTYLKLITIGMIFAFSVAGLTEGLCGAGRPGHFAGVTTVVRHISMPPDPIATTSPSSE